MDLIGYLVKKEAINSSTAEDIKEGMKRSGSSPEELILEKKIIKEDRLFDLKSDFLKIPLREVLIEEIPQDIVSLIPKESIEFYKMIPVFLDKKSRILDVGMVFPENDQAKEALKFLTRQENLTPKFFLITFSDFKKYLEKYQVPEKEMKQALERLKEETEELPKRKSSDKVSYAKLAEEAPIIKMVGVILRQAVEGGASDIHIEPARDNLKIRYRLDGILYSSLFLPLKVHPAIVARIKILSNLKIDETRIPQDGRFSTTIKGESIDFRVATFPTNKGEKVAIRVLNSEEGLKSLPKLGFEGRNLEVVKNAISKPYGLILTTGPTGCGKTTTLYTILGLLNKEGVNIVTLEDPIEYYIEGVNQSQVKPDINYTFAAGLRQILRQDPDIIMVGEIRDEETASLAIHAGLTGHLVLSTIHTTSALGVVPRLIDMGIKPFLISPTLSLAVSQRLLRVLCSECKEKVKLQGEEKKYILDKIKNLPKEASKNLKIEEPLYIYKAKGCPKCNGKGYSGRVGIYEAVGIDENLRELINERASEGDLFKEARRQGMILMEEDGVLKVLEGITSLEEVMRVTKEE